MQVMSDPAEDALALLALVFSGFFLVVIWISLKGGDPSWVISIVGELLPTFILGLIIAVLVVTVLQAVE